eukprot:643698_1
MGQQLHQVANYSAVFEVGFQVGDLAPSRYQKRVCPLGKRIRLRIAPSSQLTGITNRVLPNHDRSSIKIYDCACIHKIPNIYDNTSRYAATVITVMFVESNVSETSSL